VVFLNIRAEKEGLFLEELKAYIYNFDSIITARVIAEQFEVDQVRSAKYLREMEKLGYITKKGKGEYINYLQSTNKPEVDVEIEKINRVLRDNSPYMNFIIWSLVNLKNFYFNIPINNYIFIEVKERYELEAIRAKLFEQNIESVVNPKEMDFKDFMYRNTVPVILLRRGARGGIIKIGDINTITVERTIIDLYFYITKRSLPFPIEELGHILIKSIETGEFNFTFIDNYVRWRNLELDFLIIFSKLERRFPNLIPDRYKKRFNSMNENVKSFIGE